MRRGEHAIESAGTKTDFGEQPESASNRSAGATNQRIIRPFKPLPSGRAVVGGLLVTLAALGAFVVTSRDVEDLRVPYFVAAADLPPGHVLTSDDVRTELIDLPPTLAASSVAQTPGTSILADEVVGSVLLGPLGAGGLLQRSALTPPGVQGQDASAVEFSFTLANGRTPRSLRPGEHVAMLSTTGRDNDAVTIVVVDDAIVTDFVIDNEGFSSNGDVIVTLSISSSDDVLSAVNASRATDVTILRIPADGNLVLPETSAKPVQEANDEKSDDS